MHLRASRVYPLLFGNGCCSWWQKSRRYARWAKRRAILNGLSSFCGTDHRPHNSMLYSLVKIAKVDKRSISVHHLHIVVRLLCRTNPPIHEMLSQLLQHVAVPFLGPKGSFLQGDWEPHSGWMMLLQGGCRLHFCKATSNAGRVLTDMGGKGGGKEACFIIVSVV